MSVDLDWAKLDEGLADKVCDFLNERFRNLPLPSMLKSIHVLSFEFGSIPPTIEILHITDPYPEFYEQSYSDDDDEETGSEPPEYSSQRYEESDTASRTSEDRRPAAPTSYVDAWAPPFFPQHVGGRPGNVFPPFFHATPGLMSSGISTPTWAGFGRPPSRSQVSSAVDAESVHTSTSPPDISGTSTISSIRPRSNTIDSTLSSPPRAPPPRLHHLDSFSRPTTAQSTIPADPPPQASDTDIQIIARIHYEGNPRAHIQAELDFNYPSSSFISLPIDLTLTGLSFTGLALIAHIRNRVHFCLLEDEDDLDDENWEHMLRDICLESEIGERGKGVLKNVGKVERFLLEQGRRIISEEFVFPSFYTFIS
jgi:distribution and morphology protein 12